jgi:hypothetical protein
VLRNTKIKVKFLEFLKPVNTNLHKQLNRITATGLVGFSDSVLQDQALPI